MSFARWLRSNSERYLLAAAQERVSRDKCMPVKVRPRGLKDRFWRHVFVPIYFAMPDALRNLVFRILPGSHRQAWPRQAERPRRMTSKIPGTGS